MKLFSLNLFTVIFNIACITPACTAAVVLDSFTEGDFVVDQNGGTFSHGLSSGPASTRSVSGVGPGFWSATLTTNTGIFNYTVDLRGEPAASGPNRFSLTYSKEGGPFELLGADAFAFRIVGIIGEGDIVFENGTADDHPLRIDSIGEILYPLSWTPWEAGSQVQSFTFEIIARSADFSVTMDQIGFVPEPSALILLTSSGFILFRRRRAVASTKAPRFKDQSFASRNRRAISREKRMPVMGQECANSQVN